MCLKKNNFLHSNVEPLNSKVFHCFDLQGSWSVFFSNAKSLLFSYSIMLLLIKLVNPTMYLLPTLHMKKKYLTKIRLSLFKSIHLLERRVAYTMAHMWGWKNYFHELGLSNHSRNMRIHPHWLRISIIRNRNGEEVVFVHLSHLLLHNDCKSPWINNPINDHTK